MCVCFVKQKTAYEMRISDWSSDVCSSDLDHVAGVAGQLEHLAGHRRGNFNHGLGGFHRHQRLVKRNRIARLDHPFDDGGVGQAFTEDGEGEGLGCAQGGAYDGGWMVSVRGKSKWSPKHAPLAKDRSRIDYGTSGQT